MAAELDDALGEGALHLDSVCNVVVEERHINEGLSIAVDEVGGGRSSANLLADIDHNQVVAVCQLVAVDCDAVLLAEERNAVLVIDASDTVAISERHILIFHQLVGANHRFGDLVADVDNIRDV